MFYNRADQQVNHNRPVYFLEIFRKDISAIREEIYGNYEFIPVTGNSLFFTEERLRFKTLKIFFS